MSRHEENCLPTTSNFEPESPVQEVLTKNVAFVGRFASMNRQQAMEVARDHGWNPVDRSADSICLLVVGSDSVPLNDSVANLPSELIERVRMGSTRVVTESEFWRDLGLLDLQHDSQRFFSIAMLADLLRVPVRNLRRWQSLGLIRPVRCVHRLAYFDFNEVRAARQIAGWIAAGVSTSRIRKQLAAFSRWLPASEHQLTQLAILSEDRELLLRSDFGLIDCSGQLRLDFESSSNQTVCQETTGAESTTTISVKNHLEHNEQGVRTRETEHAHDDFSLTAGSVEETISIPFPGVRDEDDLTQNDIETLALELEDQGKFDEAAGWYRIRLAKFGADADTNFQLAELLYRAGHLEAACERYYVAVEMDPEFVEARANLGCVLAETGEIDLAIAAFEGALAKYDEYPDVHFHLAKALELKSERRRARTHWKRFLELAHDSPWSEEAIAHLRDESLV